MSQFDPVPTIPSYLSKIHFSYYTMNCNTLLLLF
jgi:hypothetical protein